MSGFSLDAILYFMLHATYRKIPGLVVLCRGQWKSSTDFGNLASLAAQMLPVDSMLNREATNMDRQLVVVLFVFYRVGV